MYNILVFLLLVVFVEGATELLCKSMILKRVREVISSVHPFFDELLKCGYCTSVWVSALAALFFTWEVGGGFVLFVLFMVCLHRLSNYLHNFNDKHLDKFYSQRRKG